MHRSSLIASVIATGGILVAGSIASVAVINAATSSLADTSSVGLVSDLVAQTALPVAASQVPTSAPAPDSTVSGAQSARPTPQASAKPSPKASALAPSQDRVSAKAAADAAVSSAGGTVIGVTKGSRGGFHAWAVTIQRKDGSLITGYVDRSSGTVYDWVTHRKPVSTSNGNGSSGNGSSGNGSSGSSGNGGNGGNGNGGSQDGDDD